MLIGMSMKIICPAITPLFDKESSRRIGSIGKASRAWFSLYLHGSSTVFSPVNTPNYRPRAPGMVVKSWATALTIAPSGDCSVPVSICSTFNAACL